ncbi:putative quinol monooxygenase [Chryseobacterium cheonjiense]|uniref:Antibiotic biosynthesis monooxygenase n=1 Tax=Chryseobacterium cheonjiense TaxID=2728845 RepID=A0A7Y0FK20_9FLAO|nr:putative quinol monooxygenase [Chryseobacterium cheonjiense]NML59169.1 antibiotic biosynthesis monooxygenase [Chryseobacterium cheonjiense]
MKIYLTAIIKAKEEYKTEVLEVLQHMVKETVNEEANELYSLHQGIEDKNHFIFYEIWKSAEGLVKHNEQPYIKAFVNLIDKKLQEKPQIYKTEII